MPLLRDMLTKAPFKNVLPPKPAKPLPKPAPKKGQR